ncbi:MAG: polysaccharide biosynthesis tyrosine autokinase [Prevotellaceae bacterium]|jgi:capsular exopolysaccharide synthesis family protein|nr:polysaccharide biosynthesis tyrosine autokinase [Prevotellaceae bacterium]
MSANQNNNSDEINIKKLIRQYLPYWKLICLTALVFVAIACAYIACTNKQYTIGTSVLIKDEEQGVGDFSVLSNLGLGNGKNNVSNEIEVFKSADLIKTAIIFTKYNVEFRAADKLQKPILYPAPFFVEIKNIDLDTLHKAIEIKITKEENNSYSFTAECEDTHYQSITVSSFPATLRYPFGTVVLQPVLPLAEIPDKLALSIYNPEKMAVNYSKTFNIVPATKTSSVLNISFIDENTERGKDFLNSFVDLYNKQAVDDKNQITINTSSFIDERLKSLTGELSNVEKDVETFKTRNKITDISSEAQLFISQSGHNESKLYEVETQLNIIQFVEQFINDNQNRDRLIPNLGITDPGLAELINRYNEMSLDKERIQRASTASNPVLENKVNQLETMRQGIKSNIVNVRKTLAIAKKDLGLESTQTVGKIQQIPRIEREFLEIKRQQQIKESLYLFLLQKREESSLALAATSPKAKVVSYARADADPVSPKTGIILVAAFLLGLLLPIGIIYLKNLLTFEISSSEELTELSKAPVLGELSTNKTNKRIVVTANDNSSDTELFRLLRNNLQFILGSEDKKVITVTSTMSNEGKSFVSANLAYTFALIDKKVLLVGLDIRNPSVANYLDIKAQHGITSYLAMGHPLDELIVKAPNSDNLDVLPGGIIPPNPNELLGKPELDKLFEKLRKRYDYIIVDTAPVGIVSDTFLVNRVSDLTLYVVREKQSDKDSVQFINELYENKKLSDIYLVLNDSSVKKNRGYRAGYHYGYYSKEEDVKRKGIQRLLQCLIKK